MFSRHLLKLAFSFSLLTLLNGAIAQKYEETVRLACDQKIVRQDNKFGVWENSNEIIPKIYDEILKGDSKLCTDMYFWVRKKKKWGIINHKKEMVLPVEYDSMKTFPDGLRLLIYKSGKVGMVNTKTKNILEAQFDDILVSDKFPSRCFTVKSGKYGMCDPEGKIILEPTYKKIYSPGFYPLLPVTNGTKEGFINTSGKVVVDLQFDEVFNFSTDYYAVVKLNGKFGFVDTTGKIVIECKYTELNNMENGVATGTFNNEKGRISKSGGFIRDPEYDYDKFFKESESYRIVLKGTKYGYIDKTNKLVIPLEYDDAFSFKEGVAVVARNGKQGAISVKNEVLIPLTYADISNQVFGSLTVKNAAGKFALFNLKGQKTSDWFDEISGFNNGVAKVKLGAATGSVNPNGWTTWDKESTLKPRSKSTYLLTQSNKIIHTHKSDDYIVNLDMIRDGDKAILATARSKKDDPNYSLELVQINLLTNVAEKTSAPVSLSHSKKWAIRKFVAVSDGYLLVTYSAAIWYDKNLNILHKKIFGLNDEGYSHEMCADVVEVGKNEKKYVILGVKKDGQGYITGFNLQTKTESKKPFEIPNKLVVVSEISGKMFEVNHKNILIIHRGDNDRTTPHRYYKHYWATYYTSLIDYEGLFNDEGVKGEEYMSRNTGYDYFTKNIKTIYTLDAIFMGTDGLLHIIAGSDERPFTSKEIGIYIGPNNMNYVKVFEKNTYGQMGRLHNHSTCGMTSALHVTRMNNGNYAVSGSPETAYDVMELFDSRFNYLGTFFPSEEVIARKDFGNGTSNGEEFTPLLIQYQYSMAAWMVKDKNSYFSELNRLSIKYRTSFGSRVSPDNPSRSMAFCDTKDPNKYLIMFEHSVAVMDISKSEEGSWLSFSSDSDDDSGGDDVSTSGTTTSGTTTSGTKTNSSGNGKTNNTSGSSSSGSNTAKEPTYSGNVYFHFDYADKNSKVYDRLYIHSGSNASTVNSTSKGSDAAVRCQKTKIYYSFTGQKSDMKYLMDLTPEDCGKKFKSSEF